MAYALRYYKELIHEDGSTHRLEIHKKDSTAEAVEIGAVIQGLALEIQGSQGDVDSPIVKTSLSMTFVDAGDIEDGRKNGFWQEFYTPDALLWKVILKARTATETSFRTMWGGYVTPDSFSESLVYRGSVNIIARDNLGHMQDFPFDAVGDADGMISLRNLVEAGWEKIQSPMVLDWRGEAESNMWLMCDGVPAPDTLMNVSQFEGMDWYKAIETALASYGIVMRYVGDNIVNVSSLRSMPLQGREVMDNLSQITPVFVAGAQRELVPAVRRIEESVDYDLQSPVNMPQVEQADYTGEVISTRLSTSSGLPFVLDDWRIRNTEQGQGWVDGGQPIYFNPNGYDTTEVEESHDNEFMWLSSSAYLGGPLRYAEYSRYMLASSLTMDMAFGPVYRLIDNVLVLAGNSATFPTRVSLGIFVKQDGITSFLNADGEWVSEQQTLTYDLTEGRMNLTIPADNYAGGFLLGVRIYYLHSTWEQDIYTPLYNLGFSEARPCLEKNTVNTVYNAENNVILSRTPEIGPAYDAVALPELIKNGIFYRSEGVILPARAWGWSGSTPQQMAVYNHLQLLCYYAKPNNLISGTIVNGDLTSGRAIYLWHGKEHLLVSGRYNLLNGMIEGAMLREFTRYEAMWGEVSETAFPDTEQDSTTNVEGGASSGGSSSTYTNTTTVNIGSGGGGGASYLNDLLDVNTDSVTAQSVLYYNGTEWVGRSLSTILNGYAKSADLLTLSNLLASMWSIDADGNLVTDKQVIIKNNLIVNGDTASGGEGGGSSVGIQGIRLNGRTYYDITDGVEDGIIDLGTIGGGTITEITYEMIVEALGYVPANSASLGSLATKDTVAWSEITNVLTGGDEFNIIPSGHNGVFSFNHRAKDGGSGTITEYRMRNGGGSYAPVRALSFIAHGGTSSQFLKADGSLDSTSYLSTAGGRISDLTIEGRGTAWLAFGNSSGTSFGSIGVNSSHEPKFWNGSGAFTIYHTGNFNPADYLPLSGGTISGGLQIGNDDNTSAVLLKTVRRGHYAVFRNTVNEMILSFGETSASTPEKMLAMGDSGLRYSADGGSTYNDILTSAGGKITSSSYLPLIIESTASNNNVAIRLKNASTLRSLGIKSDGTLFVTNVGGWDSEYPILHSGNYSDFALPLTGTTKTLSYTNNTILVLLNNGTGSASGIRYDVAGSSKAWIGYDGSSYGVSLRSYASGKHLGIKDDGTPYYDSHTLIHSGNVGEYAFTTAAKTLTSSDTLDAHLTGIYGYKDGNNPTNSFGQNAAVLSLKGIKSDPVFQLAFDGNTTSVGYRNQNYAGTWTAWKTIAFTDSNVASADYASRANILVDANKAYLIYKTSAGHLYVGDNIYTSGDTHILGNNIRLRYGTSASYGLILNPSGNVTIGDSDLASTNYKLYVSGGVIGSSFKTLGRYALGDYFRIEFYNTAMPMIQTYDANLLLNPLGGNVLIGTTNDSGSKLFVNGVTRASAFRSTNIGIECDADGNTTGYGSEINRFGSNLYLQGREGNLYLSHSEGTTFIRGLASITGAVTMASTLSVTAGITSKKLLTTGEYGIWRGDAFTGSLTQNDIAYNASSHNFYGDVRINGNLVVTGDISA